MIVRWLLAAVLSVAAPAVGWAQTKLTFGTDWLAEAEHGGFYQAVALGFYKKHGLDVTIRMGGPGVNAAQMVAAGVVDFQMSSGSFGVLNMLQQDIPVIAVASFFQKDPQVLISHPGAGNDTLAAMKGKPIMISQAARNGYWLFLRAKFGFTDDQIKPYNFSMAPFLADKAAIQQGFVSSEPYQIERQSGEKPLVHLLADSGYASYSNLVLTTAKLVSEKPDVVKAFIEASTEGWYSYLYGDPAPGNALIRAANKDMTPETIDNSIRVMKEYGIADSGDSLTLGLGAMTDARWKSFFDSTVQAGLYKADMPFQKAYTLSFVNKKYGMEMKPK
jgi:NitT/TauT family transport system substrate-binding protein